MYILCSSPPHTHEAKPTRTQRAHRQVSGRTMSADDALKCYTYRHVDLLGGYCHDNVLACDWNALRVHKQEHAVQEGRKVACRNRDTQCYAYRYTELFDSLCSGDINSCNWLGLVTHFAQKGRFEGKTMECETPETKCYLQRNPDLAAEFCGQEGDDTCEWPSIVESLMKNAESEGRPTGCLPPSPPPSPTPPPPPPSPPPCPRPPPPPPIMVVGTNGKAVTRLDSASAPSPLGGSVVIITIGITTIAVILYCFCRIYAGQPQPRLSRAPDPEGTRARLLYGTRARLPIDPHLRVPERSHRARERGRHGSRRHRGRQSGHERLGRRL